MFFFFIWINVFPLKQETLKLLAAGQYWYHKMNLNWCSAAWSLIKSQHVCIFFPLDCDLRKWNNESAISFDKPLASFVMIIKHTRCENFKYPTKQKGNSKCHSCGVKRKKICSFLFREKTPSEISLVDLKEPSEVNQALLPSSNFKLIRHMKTIKAV